MFGRKMNALLLVKLRFFISETLRFFISETLRFFISETLRFFISETLRFFISETLRFPMIDETYFNVYLRFIFYSSLFIMHFTIFLLEITLNKVDDNITRLSYEYICSRWHIFNCLLIFRISMHFLLIATKSELLKSNLEFNIFVTRRFYYTRVCNNSKYN